MASEQYSNLSLLPGDSNVSETELAIFGAPQPDKANRVVTSPSLPTGADTVSASTGSKLLEVPDSPTSDQSDSDSFEVEDILLRQVPPRNTSKSTFQWGKFWSSLLPPVCYPQPDDPDIAKPSQPKNRK